MSGRGTERYGGQRDEDGTEDELETRLRDNATGIASMLVTGLWLAAMFTGQSWWLAALLVGYIVVVPLIAVLFGDEADRAEWVDDWTSDSSADAEPTTASDTGRSSATDRRDALETLRERYAAGELTDERFERKLERLLETETLEDADEWVRERSESGDGSRSPERERERERERDRSRNREYDR